MTGIVVATALIILPATLPNDYALSAEFIAAFGISCLFLVLMERHVVDALVHQAYVHGYGLRRALLVARSYETDELMAGLLPVAL